MRWYRQLKRCKWNLLTKESHQIWTSFLFIDKKILYCNRSLIGYVINSSYICIFTGNKFTIHVYMFTHAHYTTFALSSRLVYHYIMLHIFWCSFHCDWSIPFWIILGKAVLLKFCEYKIININGRLFCYRF